MQARYYFSFRSPYSWMASRRLAEALPSWDGIELIPFWEPDTESQTLLTERGGYFPYQPMSEAKHRYILADVRRLARQLGYTVSWPIDTDPWWEASHLGYLKARELGRGMDFFWAVYRARWEQGKDISRRDTIAKLCQEIDLDADQVVGAPENEGIRRDGAECLYRIWAEDIFGVPFFIHGREKFWGVDRLPSFLDRLALSEPQRLWDFDHAGGCG
jgi:2-hydroxychromene-2-carboxylate isomerase